MGRLLMSIWIRVSPENFFWNLSVPPLSKIFIDMIGDFVVIFELAKLEVPATLGAILIDDILTKDWAGLGVTLNRPPFVQLITTGSKNASPKPQPFFCLTLKFPLKVPELHCLDDLSKKDLSPH